MIRVLIIDNNAATRARLRELLAKTPEMAASGEAATGQAALQAAREQAYDVALFDLDLPDMGGLEALSQLCRLQPNLRVIVVGNLPAEFFAYIALEAGAYAYLPADRVPQELVYVIRRVMTA